MATTNQCQIPPQFVQWGEEGLYMDGEIVEGSYHRCFAGDIFTPSFFYVNLAQEWGKLEGFMAILQIWVDEYVDMIYEMREASLPTLECLCPGLFVLCKYFGPKDKKMEWHRAMVLQNPLFSEEGGPFSKHKSLQATSQPLDFIQIKVKLVDYGTMTRTTLKDVKYMLRSMLTDFPIQGIECELLFSPFHEWRLRKRSHHWPEEANDHLYDLCNDRLLGLTFHKKRGVPNGKFLTLTHDKWTVTLDILVGHQNSKPAISPWIETSDDDGPIEDTPQPVLNGTNALAVDNFNVGTSFFKWI